MWPIIKITFKETFWGAENGSFFVFFKTVCLLLSFCIKFPLIPVKIHANPGQIPANHSQISR